MASDPKQAVSPPAPVREFHYRFREPARGHFPGHHRSTRGETGFEFRGHAPLLDAPDPRRLDLHASLRDPFGGWTVRVYAQRRAVPVVLVADLSASMGFVGTRRKLEVVADFVESLAWSAWRTGDSFSFVGCDEAVRPEWLLPATRSRAAGTPLAARLRAFEPAGGSAAGLLQAHLHLRRQRSIVFLVSDFHLPPSQLDALLASLATHQLVPVVVWDAAEFDLGERRGIAHAVDAESGERRLVWWRPALRETWARQHAGRREALQRRFRAQRLDALWIEGAFRAEDVTRHFLS